MDAPTQFEWDDVNTEHATRHGVSTAEIEAAYESSALLRSYTVKGEARESRVGATRSRRLIELVVTYREKGKTTWVRPITAWPVKKSKRSYYRENFGL